MSSKPLISDWGELMPEPGFWDKVAQPNGRGCLIWLGAVSANGYGNYNQYGHCRSVRRIMWEYHTQTPLPPNALLTVTCGERLCINPNHMEVVSRSELLRRRAEDENYEGPGARGERNQHSVLTEEQVRDIKRRLEAGERPRLIWQDYPQVDEVTIYDIKKGKSWEWV